MTIASVLVIAAVQTAVSFDVIAHGQMSEIEEARTVVIRTPEAWRALWKEHSPGPLPDVPPDFTRFTVLGVFLGSRPSAGFSVEFSAITLQQGTMMAEYVEQSPAPDDLTVQVITSPFHLICVPRTAGDVEFRKIPGPAR